MSQSSKTEQEDRGGSPDVLRVSGRAVAECVHHESD